MKVHKLIPAYIILVIFFYFITTIALGIAYGGTGKLWIGIIAITCLIIMAIGGLITVSSIDQKEFFLNYEELVKLKDETTKEYKLWRKATELIGHEEAVKYFHKTKSNRHNRNHWIYRIRKHEKI